MESEERYNSLKRLEEGDEHLTPKKLRLACAGATSTKEKKIEEKVSGLEYDNRATSEMFSHKSNYQEDLSSSSFSKLGGGDASVKNKQMIHESMCSGLAISNIAGDNTLKTWDEKLMPGINRDGNGNKSTPCNDLQIIDGGSDGRYLSNGKERVGKTISVYENRQKITDEDGDSSRNSANDHDKIRKMTSIHKDRQNISENVMISDQGTTHDLEISSRELLDQQDKPNAFKNSDTLSLTRDSLNKEANKQNKLKTRTISPKTPKSQQTLDKQTLMDFINLNDSTLPEKLTDSSYTKCVHLTLGQHINESEAGSTKQENVGNQSKKEQDSSKKGKVQRKTEPGKEFQRLLQILIRNRALKSGGCEVGTEVTGVGCLDDIVYLNNSLNQSRYFQAKYNSIQTVKISDLFSTNPNESNEFCLLRFCKVLFDSMKNLYLTLSKTKEFVFITKRDVDCELTAKKNVQYLEEITREDKILNLSAALASVYKLNTDIIEQHQAEVVKIIQDTHNAELSNIREIFSKIRLVFCFLDADNIKKLIKQNIVRTIDEGGSVPNVQTIHRNQLLFYIPYSLGKMIEAQELIRSNYSKSHLKDYGLQVMLYFPSFVEIKTHPEFINHEIKEITFITNRQIADSSLSILKEVNLEDDDCLHIVSSEATKFKFTGDIQVLCRTFFANLENPPEADLVEEFLDKTALVTYPEVKWLRKLVLNEVFDENIYSTISKDTLSRHLLHIELELLNSTKQFTSCEEWRYKVDELKKMIAYLKAKGVTDFNKNTVRIALKEELEFEDTREVLQDVQELLKMDEKSVLNMMVQDKKLNSLLIFQILGDIINEKNSLLNDYHYHEFYDLRVAPFVIDSFKESVPLMVVLYTDLPEEQSNTKIIFDEIGNVINTHNKKLIVISGTEDTALCNDLQKKIIKNVISKCYKHGFNSLNKASKETILSNEIHFQGKSFPLKELLDNDQNLASKVIDESIIWNILTNKINLLVFGHQINAKGYNEVKEYLIPMKASRIEIRKGIWRNKEIEFDKVVELLELKKGNVSDRTTIFILAGDSGSGKTTILTSMALKIQQMENPKVWVAKVELRLFFDEITLLGVDLDDPDDPDNSTRIACWMILGTRLEDRLDYKLLKELLTTAMKGNFKIVLFFDGYNEINKEHQRFICCLIKTLANKCNVSSIWVASQEHSTKGLKKDLRTDPYIITELTKHDQVKLMTQYWAFQNGQKASESPQELSNEAIDALGKWNSYNMDDMTKSFTAVAFNVIMLADVLAEVKKVHTNIELLTLYDKFVDKKLTVYDRETSGLELQSSRTITIYKKSFILLIRKVLQQIAAEYIFIQHKKRYSTYKTLPGVRTIEELKKTLGEADYSFMLLKLGIVVSVGDKVYFSHDGYAQYFFSEYIFDNRGNTIVQNFFNKHVLTLDDFKLCRRLFNTKLRLHFDKEVKQNDNKGTDASEKETPLKVETARQDIMDKLANTWKQIVITANEEKLESILVYLLKNLTKGAFDKLVPSITSKLSEHFELDTAQQNRFCNEIQENKGNKEKVARLIVEVNSRRYRDDNYAASAMI